MGFDVQDAIEAYTKDKDSWGDIYEAARHDLSFYAGNQWEESDKQLRLELNRPALVINRLPQFVHQTVNEVRMNTPTINPIPVDDKADEETARILKGLIKHIEYSSGADVVYDTALEYAVKCGIGFIRVEHDYENEYGPNQELRLKTVVNPLAVYLDSDSIEYDGKDSMRATVLDTMSEDSFKAIYPKFNPVSFQDTAQAKTGQSKDFITVAEVFRIEETPRKIAYLQDGSVADYEEGAMDGVKSVRTLKKRKVHRYKMSGQDILEETTFPGIYIPIVPVYGEQHWSDGDRMIFSLIRQAKDAQRRYNHWASKETEVLSQAPIAPFVAGVGQTEDFADDWRNPERSTVLRYKTTDAFGNALPPPQRIMPPPIPAGIVNAMQGAVEDMKATMGIYDNSLGLQANEKSGIAIQARQKQGDVATFHFGDNLRRSVTQVGRIIISAIPEVYDTQRTLRIIGEEDKPEMIGINGAMAKDQEQHFNLKDAGQYDVRVSTGPSFTTLRQESADMMGQLLQAQPQLMGVIGDLWMKNTDNPAAEAMANRIRKTIPPQLLEGEDGNQPQDPQVAQLKQGMQNAVNEIAQLQQALQQCQAELQNKQADHEIKSKELELKAAELHNRRKEINVQAYQAQYGSPEQPSMNKPAVNLDDENPEMKPPQDVMMEQAQAQAQADLMKPEVQIQIEQLKIDQAELQQDAQIAQAQQAQISALISQVAALTSAIKAPKQVIRDQAGMIQGVQ